MTFEEWADRTFGSNFINEEPITYFRMSAAWDNAQNEEREECAKMVDHILKEGGGTYGDAMRKRYNVKVTGAESSAERPVDRHVRPREDK